MFGASDTAQAIFRPNERDTWPALIAPMKDSPSSRLRIAKAGTDIYRFLIAECHDSSKSCYALSIRRVGCRRESRILESNIYLELVDLSANRANRFKPSVSPPAVGKWDVNLAS